MDGASAREWTRGGLASGADEGVGVVAGEGAARARWKGTTLRWPW